ncbi:MAG TPA: tetratricopeptide repeat protein [Acidimicrobiales bacterium]|nr:tetratricopeptide repeat protein [Acidimicrobiales bacterium]
MTAELPSGELTFMFTDIEGSTRLFRELGDGYRPLLARHHAIVRSALASHDGYEVKTEGDSFFAVFTRPESAVAAAVAIQSDLAAESWPHAARVRVRIGLHTGEAEAVDGDYVDLAVHRAARVAGAGHGGQVLVSSATAAALDGVLPAALSLRSLGAFRLRHLDDPESLAQLEGAGLDTDHPALRALRVERHNVRPQPTRFVGRREERRRLEKLLADEPLVTIVAPGGFGKSRLAAEIAVELADVMRDGSTFVELGALREDGMVAAAVVDALGGHAGPGRDGLAALSDVAAGRAGLIVLDEAERVAAGVARVVGELRTACPQGRILVTSRQPLTAPNERVVVLEGLGLPEDDEIDSATDAVALLLDRLGVSEQSLSVADGVAAATLCRKLDGLPLAIELAAARVPELGLAGVLAELDAATTGDDPVGDAIRWSYGLLGPSAQRLFRRLPWVAAHADAEAIATVVTGEGLDGLERGDVADLLQVLVDRGLLRVSHDNNGHVGFRMLETFREVAAVELEASGERERVDRNLVDWAVDVAMAERVVRHNDGSPSTDYGPRLPLFFAALDAGERVRHPGTAVILLEIAPTVTSHGAWAVLGQRAASIAEIEGAIPIAAGGLLAYRIRAAFAAGDASAGLELLAALEERFAEMPDLQVAVIEADLANDVLRVDPFRASRMAEHALPILEEHAVPPRVSALHAVGATRMMFGKVDSAREALERCLELATQGNDERSVANALLALGNAAFTLGDFDEAWRLLEDAVERLRRTQSPAQLGPALAMAGHAAALRGDLETGVALLEESLALRERFSDAIGTIFCLVNLGDVYDRAGRRADAHASFARAFDMTAAMGVVPLQHAAAHGLAVTAAETHARGALVVLAAAVARGIGTSGIDAPVTDAALARLRAVVADAEAAEAEGQALTDEDFVARAALLR